MSKEWVAVKGKEVTNEEIIDKIYAQTLKEQIDKLPRVNQIKRYIQLFKEYQFGVHNGNS